MKIKKLAALLLMAFILLTVGVLGGWYGAKRWAVHHAGSEKAGEDKPAESEEEAAALFQCPMHPFYTSPEQGDCPICGMRLVPVEVERKGHKGGMEKPGIAAHAVVDPRIQQLIGVTKATVEIKPLEKDIRTVGLIDVDERRVAHVQTKFEGWIEKLFVDFVGKSVKRGDPLMSIYSPELLSSQEEYVLALRYKERFAKSSFEEVSGGGEAMVDSARRRLKLFGVSQRDIRRLERGGKPRRALTIYSPLTGVVLEKKALLGTHVTPAMELFTIADLSSVWVIADIYEADLPLVKIGQEAALILPYYPEKALHGKVSFIYPILEPKTRTVKVRFDFPNPSGQLKPDMFVTVKIKVDFGERLAVPADAVLDTGERQIAYVDLGEGHFEPREVKLGPKVGNHYIVLSGLKAGDVVVTGANFLIDSESKLKAIISGSSESGEHQH